MTLQEIEGEFREGYLDGYCADLPAAGRNRTRAYRHSFTIARAEKAGRRLPSARFLRLRAARIKSELLGN